MHALIQISNTAEDLHAQARTDFTGSGINVHVLPECEIATSRWAF